MVIDTSALVAILLNEPEASRLTDAVSGARFAVVGAPTLVEASAVMVARSGSQGAIALDALLQRLSIDVIPMTARAAAHARTAYARWGKGVGAPGVLNFGDCLTYGVAAALEMPILFKGEDFTRTDARAATY